MYGITDPKLIFFLVSEQLADNIKKCFISDRYCRKSFDHRPIFLQLGRRNTSGRKAVNNRIVKHPLILLTALIAVYETYLSHIATNNFGIVRNIVDNALDKLITIEDDIREISRYCDSWDWKALSDAEKLARDTIMARIDLSLGETISIDELEVLPRSVEDDIFFEELNRNVNRSILQLQLSGNIREKEKIKKLSNKLIDLKVRFEDNIVEIRIIEEDLNSILEREVEDKVQNYIKDDIILNEKMTPQFLRLAKNNKSEPMSCIKNGDGIKFNSINDRGEYIRSFFEQLYTVPDTALLGFRGCVRDFLGEEICNNTVVRGMILTDPEKTRLDQPITLEELDEALASSNKRSAPGIDGVSNRLITAI